MKYIFLVVYIFLFSNIKAQAPIDSTLDTMYFKRLKKVEIIETRKVRTAIEEAEYQKLRRRVIKLYPYALMAKQIYVDLNNNMQVMQTKKEKRKYKKGKEAELRERFEAEIKNLYTTDGPVLVKLIYRETGHTTYDLIKELKTGFKAWIFQIAAKNNGYNLKDTYDPAVDVEIEGIIQSMQKDGTLPTGL
ncbi:MAG: DUF4294 domain-containing protein [Bacteroidetes bacterium]|nr:DUF4294 domain-containing protein [Bacteroidota bacterium]